MEDGYTAGSQSVIPGGDTIPGQDNSRIQFGYDERLFPEYSWRGYAVMSDLQVCLLNNCVCCFLVVLFLPRLASTKYLF